LTGADTRAEGAFGKKVRLRGRSNFRDIFRSPDATRLKGKFCRVIAADSEGEETQFGISVSKKAGGAVRRNRLKRIIRESLRTGRQSWPTAKKIIISLEAPVDDEAALLDEIKTMLEKIR
jgi:ribonuclease P protein component